MKPLFSNPANVALLTRELASWEGTPWAHMAAESGFQTPMKYVGADCKTVLAEANIACGFLPRMRFPAHVLVPGFAPEDESPVSIAKFLKSFVDAREMIMLDLRRDRLMFGDVLSFRRAARAHHLGQYLGGRNRMFWHLPGPGFTFMRSSLNEWGAYLNAAYRLVEDCP